MPHHIRKAQWDDREQLFALYRLVAEKPIGLARRPEEISLAWMESLIEECTEAGLILVLQNTQTNQIDGLIHASGNSIRDLNHVMGHLSFLIRPELQGQGLGKYLFQTFLSRVLDCFPHIERVELRARSSNRAAIGLYESLGFQQEGLFRFRIRNRDGQLEDGIPMVWLRSSAVAPSVSHPISSSEKEGSSGEKRL